MEKYTNFQEKINNNVIEIQNANVYQNSVSF